MKSHLRSLRGHLLTVRLMVTILVAAGLVVASDPAAAGLGPNQPDFPPAIVRCDPSLATGYTNGTITVDLYLEDTQDTNAIDVHVTFDESIATVVDQNGDADGTQIAPVNSWFHSGFGVGNVACNPGDPSSPGCSAPEDVGTIWYAATQLSGTPAVTGSGPFARVTFQPLAAGTFTMNFFYHKLSNPQGSEVPSIAQDCTMRFESPTRTFISRFDAAVADGQVTVEWETAAEENTAGFFLYGLDERSGRRTLVNEGIVPAMLETPAGGTYRLLDAGVQAGGTYTYILEEIAAGGERNEYGPYRATAAAPAVTASVLAEGGGARISYERIPRPASLEVQPAQPEPNRDTDVPEALPDDRDAPENLPLQSWLPLVVQALQGGGFGEASAPTPTRAKLAVRQSGLYYLAAADIGPALGLSAARTTSLIRDTGLKLTNQGQPVATLAAAGNAGLYFYGQALDSPYTRDNVYWLQQAAGTRMSMPGGMAPAAVAPATFPASSHAEQNLLPAPGLFNDPAADYWMWDYVVAGDAGNGMRTFALQADGAAAQGPVSLTARFMGLTESGAGADHRARIKLNGADIGDAVWTGAASFAVSLPVDPALLVDGANTLEVAGLLDAGVPYSVFYVNSFDLSYRRSYRALKDVLAFSSANAQAATVYGFSSGNVLVFDVSNPRLPKRVTALKVEARDGGYRVTFKPAAANARHVALTTAAALRITTLAADTPSALKGPNGADYVILTTGGLAQPARALAAYRQGRGLRARVVDIQDVYDEFNGGVADPGALQAFLAYAYANWKPAPRYVLLAGGGSFDYKNYLGYGDSLVPPVMVGALSYLSAADGRYGDVVGDDGAPELAVGRLPVLTVAEFRAVIAKLQAYEAGDPAGWSKQVLLLADNVDPQAGDFPADSDELAAGLPAGYTVRKVYLGPLSAAEARSQALAALGAGAGVFNYVGHGGVDTLADEKLLTGADVSTLHNSPRLPFMSAATCAVGNYALPGYRSLGVLLALQGDGGAAGVFAPTGSSMNADGVAMDRQLFQNLFGGPAVRAGDAVRVALVQQAAGGGPRYVLDTYNLMGDPGLELRWR